MILIRWICQSSVSVHSSIDICDTFKYKFYHNSVKKIFSASGFSALGALKSCASKHVVFGIFILPEAKLREKKRELFFFFIFVSSRGYQLISSRWKTPRIKFAFYVFVHKKNKFRLLFFFRLNFKNKNREHISRNRHKYVFSRIFGEYKYAWFILVYIFIFHEYHRIHIASNRYQIYIRLI